MSLIWQFFLNLLDSVLYSFLWPEYKGLGLKVYLGNIYVIFFSGILFFCNTSVTILFNKKHKTSK